MQTSLRGIANRARKTKNYRFTGLYGAMNESFLHESFALLNKKAAAGVDRVVYEDYRKDQKRRVRELVGKLKAGKYRARLVKRVYIPKENGKERPLGLPTLEDKLLQTSASRLLTAIYEADFLESSFGYRPHRGAKEAVKALDRTLWRGKCNYVVEADIKGFFDNIDHGWLLRMVEQRVNDRAFLGLIRKWLKAGVLEPDGTRVNPVTGTPQGGVISPVLANIYLHYALDLWFEKVVKRHCRGEAHLCRYADDFVCVFQNERDAQRFYKSLVKRLAKFGLSLAGEKTRILSFSRFWSPGKSSFDFLGFEFRWGINRDGKHRLRLRTAKKKQIESLKRLNEWCKENRHLRLKRLFEVLNSKLKGYYEYFGVTGNYRRLNGLYGRLRQMLFKWLNRRSQRRSFDWLKFCGVLDRYCLLRPSIGVYRTGQYSLF